MYTQHCLNHDDQKNELASHVFAWIKDNEIPFEVSVCPVVERLWILSELTGQVQLTEKTLYSLKDSFIQLGYKRD